MKKTNSPASNYFLKLKASLVFVLICTFGFGQVYNYHPISNTDIETNPSNLASKIVDNRFQLIHHNGFIDSQPFMFNSLRLSRYLEGAFTGIGLTFNNTKLDNNLYYNHIGIGFGYRNVLFDKIEIRIGGMYKLSQINAPYGNFDYLIFTPKSQIIEKWTKSNYNVSLSLSYEGNKYYLSTGYSNLLFPFEKTDSISFFPKYFFINAGNFLSLFNCRDGQELSYTVVSKNLSGKYNESFSHFLNFKSKNQRFKRRLSGIWGLRLGYVDNSFLQFTPSIILHRRSWIISLAYNFHQEKEKFKSVHFATSQIIISLTL